MMNSAADRTSELQVRDPLDWYRWACCIVSPLGFGVEFSLNLNLYLEISDGRNLHITNGTMYFAQHAPHYKVIAVTIDAIVFSLLRRVVVVVNVMLWPKPYVRIVVLTDLYCVWNL